MGRLEDLVQGLLGEVSFVGTGERRHAIVRDGVIGELREQARRLAAAGLPAREIEQRLVHEGLTAPERELAKSLALAAEAGTRNMRVAEVLDSETRGEQLRERGVEKP
jgi:hypothetical protein